MNQRACVATARTTLGRGRWGRSPARASSLPSLTCVPASSSATIVMSSSAEQSFRSNLSQFRWAQSNTAEPQQDAAGPPQGRFARFYNAIGGGYIPLRSNERSNDEEAYFALSRWERCERMRDSVA